jgi:hypothetical protein
MRIGFSGLFPCPAVGIRVGFVEPPNANTPLENCCVIIIIIIFIIQVCLLSKFIPLLEKLGLRVPAWYITNNSMFNI